MNDRCLNLMEVIKKNPGINFREIMRNTNLKNGILSHYLNKLEKNGSVKIKTDHNKKRFYDLNISENEFKIISALRAQTTRDLLLALIENEGLSFQTLVKTIAKSASTTSLYLNQIVSDDLVRIEIKDFKKIYFINCRESVDKFVETCRPNIIAKSSAEFEDIMNSL